MQLLKKTLTHGLMVLGLSFGLMVSVLASDFEETKALAEKGDTSAQFSLAMTYEHGSGFEVKANPTKAVELYKKLAENGDSQAAYRLADMYKYGNSINQDDVQAFNWYKKSAQLGDVAAQSEVGLMYENGKGVEQDYNKAFEWYQKSTYKLMSFPRTNLDAKYNESDGNKVEWYKKMANQGDDTAQLILGFLYHNGEGVKQSNTQAKNWFSKVCEQDPTDCHFYRILKQPEYVANKNTLKILNYDSDSHLYDSAKYGNAHSQYKLGTMYYEGKGVQQSYTKAFEWFQNPAEKGSTIAQYRLGAMYYEGKGVQQSYTKAFEWFQKASEQADPHPTAQYTLGAMYYNGEGVQQSYTKAFEWLQKAANNKGGFVTYFTATPSRGDILAPYALGIMYDGGKGVRQDKTQAKSWFGKSCDNGNQDGCDFYRELNEQGY